MTLPLAGCRVLDLGIITAGAATSALLADLGADVIKVESPTYRDPFRGWATSQRGERKPATTPFFAWTNRNKRGISLDLKRGVGRQAFLQLVAKSNIVVENFSRGVLERLGLDYDHLRTVNPNVILASISSAGETGPDAGFVSYGTTLEALGGLAWLSGYADGEPAVSGRDLNYPDQVVAIFAAGMIATAWRTRLAGGGGAHLDLSQRELTSFLCGEAIAAGVAGQASPRVGNSQEPHVAQECFRGADGSWVAVTVDAESLSKLKQAIGWTDGETPRALMDRLAQWCGGHSVAEATRLLAALGIAAAPVQNGQEVLNDEGRSWRFALDRAPDGTLLKGFPFQLRQTPMAIHRHAPAIGADTDEILRSICGLSAAEIAALKREGVIESAEEATRESSKA